ncbi:MAG TPA: hypothetical protein VK818_13615 [Methylomirabilota bacterium]|nr:hypothetical protein [Methylomirabilota bacterium]
MIKDKHGKWGAYLHSYLAPLLSTGLDQEAPSEKDFSDVYSTK